MAGTQAKGASHVDCWQCPPEALKVVTAKTSAFYDERVEKPVPEWLVNSIIDNGFVEPVVVMRDGEDFVIDDGRQRQRALIEANRKLRAAGKEPLKISYIIKRPRDGESGIVGLSAVLNLHVTDEPSMRARKAQRMLDFGASKDDVAASFGFKSTLAVDNLLAVLDCSSAVQKAIDEGKAPISLAAEMKGLTREKQAETLSEMIAKGVTRGAAGKRAVREVKKGRAVPAKGDAVRMRNRVVVQGLLDTLTAMDLDVETSAHDLPLLRWVLGQPGSEAMLPTKVAEALLAMGAKK